MMTKSYLLLLLCLPMVWMGCDKDTPDLPDQEELITTVVLTVIGAVGDPIIEFRFADLDGDGGNAPEIQNADLAANTSYTTLVEFYNESVSPAENVTLEIEEEDEEHQIFFSSNTNLTFDYNDSDENGDPIGLFSTLTTGDAGSGAFSIVLRHEPDKEASGVSDGDITNAGGETDIEVSFDVNIL